MTRAEWRESLGVALETISSQKLRSFLTMMGVVIGVASVIGVAAIIHGLNQHITDKVREIGTQVFFVTRFKAFSAQRMTEEIRNRKYLSYRDAAAIRQQCPTVQKASPFLTRALFFGHENEIHYRDNHVDNPFVRGVEPDFIDVFPVYSVKEGRFLTEAENQHAGRVCVLGAAVADALFGPLDPVGREVRLNSLPFKVIGVFEPHQGLFGGPGVDQFVIIPYRTFAKLYPEIEEIIVAASVAHPSQLGKGQDEVVELLRRRRHVPVNAKNDFEISSPDVVVDLWKQLTGAIVVLTLIIASIGLLVGGIGVMNIMLVSVTERTAEIGVRKAVGARRQDIRAQFLLEAVALTGVGGMIGIVTGILISVTVAAVFPSLPTKVSLFWTAMGMVISIGVGLFFGIYPAGKAASLDPVRCLRYE